MLVAWGFFLVDVVLGIFGDLPVSDYLSWLVNYGERQTKEHWSGWLRSDRFRLSAAIRIWPANVGRHRYLTLLDLPYRCQVYSGTRPSQRQSAKENRPLGNDAKPTTAPVGGEQVLSTHSRHPLSKVRCRRAAACIAMWHAHPRPTAARCIKTRMRSSRRRTRARDRIRWTICEGCEPDSSPRWPPSQSIKRHTAGFPKDHARRLRRRCIQTEPQRSDGCGSKLPRWR